MTDVRCMVHSCEFWGKGNRCTAERIWVKNNFTGDEGDDDDLLFNPQIEFAEEVGTGGIWSGTAEGEEIETAAFSSRQTCCETMRLKGGPDTPCGGCR